MTNSKKKLFTVLAVAIVLCISTMILAACSADSVVKFMVQNDEGEWQELSSQTVGKKDTAVAPTAPVKEYYEFANWYTDKDFTTIFDGSAVKGDMEVYAKYTPIEAAVVMDGVNKGNKKLADVKANNAGIVAKNGLTFDGWYTDANCQVKWEGEADVQTLYAKSVAKIIFTNGWAADDFVKTINPGEKIDLQKEVTLEDQTKTTFEKANIIKTYMSDKDVKYVDDEGVVIDFNKPFDKNTTITVLWNSATLGEGNATYVENPKKAGSYYLNIKFAQGVPESLKTAPIMSFLSEVTITVDGQPKTVTVDEIYVDSDTYIGDAVKKVIFGKDIKVIKGFNAPSTSLVEELVLPANVKVIDNSFNNMPNLKSVNLPNGVEVIVNSFFKNTANDRYHYGYGTVHEFDIAVPASVKNMSIIPNNFTFAEDSAFAKDAKTGCIYLTKGTGETAQKVLVSDPQAYAKFNDRGFAQVETIVVPEGYQGIQVGTYVGAYDYLKMSSSFSFVNYNAEASAYDYYYAGDYTQSPNILNVVPADMEDVRTYINTAAYSITNTVNGMRWSSGGVDFGAGYVIIPTEKISKDLPRYTFMGSVTGYEWNNGMCKDIADPALAEKLVAKDAVVNAYVTTSFEGKKANVKLASADFNLANIKTAIIDALGLDASAQARLEASTFKFTANNAAYEIGAITEDTFVTMEIAVPPTLTIHTNWQVGYTGNGHSAGCYTTPAEATNFRKDNFKIIKMDIAGMTAETIKADIKAQASSAAMKGFFLSPIAGQANIDAYLDYYYANATAKFTVNGKEVDPATITLDNGDVTLNVEWTLPAANPVA